MDPSFSSCRSGSAEFRWGDTAATHAIGRPCHFSDLFFSVFRVASAIALTRVNNERIKKMSASLTDLIPCDEETQSNELSDDALELAAGKYWEVGNPFTIAFCTGLDTCPA